MECYHRQTLEQLLKVIIDKLEESHGSVKLFLLQESLLKPVNLPYSLSVNQIGILRKVDFVILDSLDELFDIVKEFSENDLKLVGFIGVLQYLCTNNATISAINNLLMFIFDIYGNGVDVTFGELGQELDQSSMLDSVVWNRDMSISSLFGTVILKWVNIQKI